jgi:hypothetical protein
VGLVLEGSTPAAPDDPVHAVGDVASFRPSASAARRRASTSSRTSRASGSARSRPPPRGTRSASCWPWPTCPSRTPGRVGGCS